MKLKKYIGILLGITLAACSEDSVEDLVGVTGNDGSKKDIVLIRMGDDEEVREITSRLYDNIPSAWEIGKKTILDYEQLEGDKTAVFDKYVENGEIYCTVVIDVRDVISGKYPETLLRELKYYKRDLYVIATQPDPELQKTMLNLIGVYMEPGYYGINYDNLQRYRIFPSTDPYAKDNMIGRGVDSFKKGLVLLASDAPSEEMYNQQMSDKEALKSIEIYNRVYGYAKGDNLDYKIETSPYKMREGIEPDVVIDNNWTISAYNFQIYSKNNNCILSIANTTGNGFACNVRDYTTPKTFNVYAYLWNLMQEASGEVAVHADGNVFREISFQPQTVNHGSSYTENSGWSVSVGVSPVKLADEPWQAFKVSFSKTSGTSVSYKTKTMDLACKGRMGNGIYSKLWQFIPGQFYEKQPAFVYETSLNRRWIDAVQAMTPNYVTWGGYTLRQNYLAGINNSMKLHKQSCIYTLQSDANPGVVSVTVRDAMKLQKTKVHYNCGIRYGHQSSGAEIEMAKTVWIDFGQWEN